MAIAQQRIDAFAQRWRDSYPAAVRCLLAERDSATGDIAFTWVAPAGSRAGTAGVLVELRWSGTPSGAVMVTDTILGAPSALATALQPAAT